MKRGAVVQGKVTQWQESSRQCERVYAICVLSLGFPCALSPSGLHWRAARQWRWWKRTTTQNRQAGSVCVPVAHSRVCAERACGAHSGRVLCLFLRAGQKQGAARVDSVTSLCVLPALPRWRLSMLTVCARRHCARTFKVVAHSWLVSQCKSGYIFEKLYFKFSASNCKCYNSLSSL